MTPKQRLFVEHYVGNGFNATDAAIKAGYSKKTAYAIGEENLRKPEIETAVEKSIRAKLKNVDRLTVRWLEEVERLAFSDIREVSAFDEKGVRNKASAELSDDAARTIESVESTETLIPIKGGEPMTKVSTKIKLHSKTKALEILGKYLALIDNQDTGKTPDEKLDAETRRARIAYLMEKKQKK